MKFGEIYFVKHVASKSFRDHMVVVLCEDSHYVFVATLSSRIFKLFPNFGRFGSDCLSCQFRDFALDYIQRCQSGTHLDTDCASILNFKKYNFLRKETFIFFNNIKKENKFDFDNRVTSGDYIYYGELLEHNKKSSVIAFTYSQFLNPWEKHKMLDFYKLSK